MQFMPEHKIIFEEVENYGYQHSELINPIEWMKVGDEYTFEDVLNPDDAKKYGKFRITSASMKITGIGEMIQICKVEKVERAN